MAFVLMVVLKRILDIAAVMARMLVNLSAWIARMSFVLLFALAFGVAAVSIQKVFNGLSALVEAAVYAVVPDRKRPLTVRQRLDAPREALERELALSKVDNIIVGSENKSLRGNIDGLERRETLLAGQLAESRRSVAGLSSEVSRLRETELVTYRGQRVLAKEAVSDTAERLGRRASIAAGRNLSSMPGELIPFWGAFVVAAATAWELKDACDALRDLHQMDVAFNPEHTIDDREVCGKQVPSGDELLAMLKNSPDSIWQSMRKLYGRLPDIDTTRFSSLIRGWWPFESPFGRKDIEEITP